MSGSFSQKEFLGVPGQPIGTEHRRLNIAHIGFDGRVAEWSNGVDERRFSRHYFLHFIVILFALLVIDRLELRVHEEIEPRFPWRRRSFLARKPKMGEAVGFD